MMEFLVTGCTGRVVESAGEKQRSGHNVVNSKFSENNNSSVKKQLYKCIKDLMSLCMLQSERLSILSSVKYSYICKEAALRVHKRLDVYVDALEQKVVKLVIWWSSSTSTKSVFWSI